MAHDIPSTRVRRALADVLKRAELGLAELGDIENSLEERDRPRYGGKLDYRYSSLISEKLLATPHFLLKVIP